MGVPGSNFMQTPPPLSFNTPIYNHMASSYQHAVPPQMKPMDAQPSYHQPEHNCHCGDTCSCFGCAAHPNNATMIEYMRSMHQFMETGQFGAMPPPTYDIPSYPHQPGFGAEANLNFNAVPNNYFAPSPMNFQTSFAPNMNMPQPTISTPSPWPPTSTPGVMSSNQASVSPFFAKADANTSMDSLQTARRESAVSLPIKTEEQIQSPTLGDSPSEGKDEEVVTLSPSSFFWQEMVLPGCNDETGTCQCGDGCECVGCLTHGGHTGVPLEMPDGSDKTSSTPQDTFRDFLGSTEGHEGALGAFTGLENAPS